MVCKNCGNSLREGEKFCTNCGTYNDPDDVEMEDNSYTSIDEFSTQAKIKPKKEKKKKEKKPKTVVEEYNPNEDPLVAAYVGEDYKWVVQRPFNIYALLLSWIYFLYRKLYLIGILGLVLLGLIIKLLPIILIPYIVLSMVFSGLFFNKIYLDIVEKKVQKIESNSKALDNVEEICKKKGGVNVWLPLLIFFIFLVIMLASYVNIGAFNPTVTGRYASENSTNLANCKSLCKQIYRGLDDKQKTGILEEMSCEIELKTPKIYNIYIKINSGSKFRYLYYKNDATGYYNLSGDTDNIEMLEDTLKTYGLSDGDKEFLAASKELDKRMQKIQEESEYEDKLIKKNAASQEKLHYVFTKDDILN